jgi:ribonuclease E
MPNKMLIDATHPEETRVVVVRGNRVEEFDFESAQRKQLRGNIYLAKVTRVEPSLQAAFVEYGGNRHGFLAFSEIHPDYYQIPVADRQALIEEEERAARDAEAEHENRSGRRRGRNRGARRRDPDTVRSDVVEPLPQETADATPEWTPPGETGEWLPPFNEIISEHGGASNGDHAERHHGESGTPPAGEHTVDHYHDAAPSMDAGGERETSGSHRHEAASHPAEASHENATEPPPVEWSGTATTESASGDDHTAHPLDAIGGEHRGDASPYSDNDNAAGYGAETGDGEGSDSEDDDAEEEIVESVGGDDALEEVPERTFRLRRQYKIQEVIKRRQVMLVQVVKEERGNKGAALTTYLSLAGRYSVLMPNTARGGGISRKITSAQDRARLKDVVQDLDVPEGMGIILRTAGAARSKPEIKRDFEYLLRMWETVRDLTLKSQAPSLVYEEGSLIKRSIRDLYNKDIEDIVVAGEPGYREAREFMGMLMPSHTRLVKLYRDGQPLFSRLGVESQLDAMFSPTVQLRSGGYIVINQTEALVSIDVNSGRATREHHIEDTALKTNLEAAEEIARQLRLRDLAGLIVIDFIDMDEKRNNRAVERRLSDHLKHDRARIQVGRISHFGLLEMSRQRIRASVLESSTEPCPHCGGSGHVRSVSSVALQLLRSLEEMLMKGATHNLVARTRTEVALYVLNHKRAHLRSLEERFRVTLAVIADPAIAGQQSFVIGRGEQMHTVEAAKALLAEHAAAFEGAVEEDALDADVEAELDEEADAIDAEREEQGEGDGRRRRRRGRRGRRGESVAPAASETIPEQAFSEDEVALSPEDGVDDGADDGDESGSEGERSTEEGGDRPRRRRRGRRGGRRRRSPEEGSVAAIADELDRTADDFDVAASEVNRYRGETPADTEPADDEARSRPAVSAAPGDTVVEAVKALDSSDHDGQAAAPDDDQSADAQPRRRSTVRERVSFFGDPSEQNGAPEPDPTATGQTTHPGTPNKAEDEPEAPAVSDTAEGNPSTPRRSGWWSRR